MKARRLRTRGVLLAVGTLGVLGGVDVLDGLGAFRSGSAIGLIRTTSAQTTATPSVDAAASHDATSGAAATRDAKPVAASAATIADVAWIAGDREQRTDRGVARETWIGPAGGMLLGMSLTSRPGKPAQYEHLRIAADADGTLAYFSIPSGQAPTTFRLKSLAPGEVVFENPTHDFPQRIVYRDLGGGRIAARIEGDANGRVHGVDWTYAPVE